MNWWQDCVGAWSGCETDQANAQAIAPYDAPGPAVGIGAGSLFRLDFRARLFPADMVAIVAVRTLLANAGGTGGKSMRQYESKHITPCRDGYVLDSADRVGHRRRAEVLTGIEVPEGMAGLGIDGFE